MIHIILLIAGLIGLWPIFTLIFGWIPPIQCNLQQERIEILNSFFISASATILGSIIFFYLLVFIPQTWTGRKYLEMINGKLKIVGKSMQVILLYIIYANDIKEGKFIPTYLKETDFSCITKFESKPIRFCYSDNLGSGLCNDGSDELCFLHHYSDKIECMTDFEKNPIFNLQSQSVIKLINNIHGCAFIKDINFYYSNKDNSLKPTLTGLPKSVFNFYKLYLELNKILKLPEIKILDEKPPTWVYIKIDSR